MDSGRDRTRMNVEGDRLSVLPDDLILEILAFVGVKDAIGTCVLSSRWRYVWTAIAHLSFSSDDFCTMDKFFDFVTHVLSLRNNQAPLSLFKLYASGRDGRDAARRIINHAFSLNAQHVNITFMFQFTSWLLNQKQTGYPLSFSSSHTPKHLTLSWRSISDYVILTSTRELSSLTTLIFKHITLHDGFLSMCPNLENLTLNCCQMTGSDVLRICHPRLSNLTLDKVTTATRSVDVVTPQLKSLTILKCFGRRGISADAFHFLEEAQLS
ncbi:F-box/FBD/LRR-repeat protein At5g22700-like [Bidens hawaiensis]|uniref:F-box/FBD/LRR-repeat protein At5g22700-like n=1 Tax=Bidens hawaiensis TaxID=980011 RepID=UPI004049EF3D